MKKSTLAALGLALASLPVSAANWSDTYLGYQYSNQFRDPGIATNEVKHRLELSGVYGWDYGTNFFDVNMLAASSTFPANNPQQSTYGGTMGNGGQPQKDVPGATEVYVVYRSNFDLGKVFKTNMAFGPVREVDFTAGFDFDSTDNLFASNKKFGVMGFQVGFDIKHGFWNLGVGACREKNYNGIVQKEVNFKTGFIIWNAWEKSFDLGGVPLAWKGWVNYLGAKGKDGFGVDTKPETVGDTYLLADVSSLFGRKKGAIFVGPGFEYWNNKFGGKNVSFTDPAVVGPNGGPWNANSQVNALLLAVEFHF